MKVSQIFYAAISIGMCFGICFTMLISNSFDVKFAEILGGAIIIGSIGLIAFFILQAKLRMGWHQNIVAVTPIKDWWNGHSCNTSKNLPAECFNCDLTTCHECPLYKEGSHAWMERGK